MARGRLRVYLGAAPGVGKTYAMLGEGHRRVDRGTDVVVGLRRGPRPSADAQPWSRASRWCLARRSSTAARPSPRWTSTPSSPATRRSPSSTSWPTPTSPGSRNAKRWQDVEDLLDAGIDVITTVNIQHLESLNDVVESITGVGQRETVPDEVVRRADQIELVDMSPEALRRRMAHGNVYRPGEDRRRARRNYFRLGNLTALRELALLWVADRVDEGLARYRAEQGIDAAVAGPRAHRGRADRRTGGRDADPPRRADRRADGRAATSSPCTSPAATASRGAAPDALARQRALVESLGGTFHAVVGDDVADGAARLRPRRQCHASS